MAYHRCSDGRESDRTDDSRPASRIIVVRAKLELEMAETEECLVEARSRKQKGKLQVAIAQSAKV